MIASSWLPTGSETDPLRSQVWFCPQLETLQRLLSPCTTGALPASPSPPPASLCCSHSRPEPATGPLHWLFPQPKMPSPEYLPNICTTCSFTSFRLCSSVPILEQPAVAPHQRGRPFTLYSSPDIVIYIYIYICLCPPTQNISSRQGFLSVLFSAVPSTSRTVSGIV